MIAYIAGYIVLGSVWTIMRMRSLLASHKNKEAAVYGGTMGICLVIGALLLARTKLPSFILPVQRLLEPFGQYLLKH
ncbi:hypothetical protein OMP38_26205 [Cohnella ginsengisoli]|uniref:Uncharacterized protein n=1 Tax=Cohnella ginsengisoli TaxID=425004 RepID=A0A9X4QQN7_9BACL|nr:hypothetical protein [Cohnella ginsengisoli]MDG0793925.1 hypothetical protein [Cohnella ginsengisoli]